MSPDVLAVVAPVSAAFIDYFGLGAITPLLPFFTDEQTPGSQDATGYVLSCQYAGVIFGSLFAGAISDRIGRRNTLMLILMGDVVFFSLTGFATELGGVNAMMAIRFLAGVFTPLAPAIAWLIDAAGGDEDKRARNQGLMGVCSVMGFMSGNAIAGFIGYEYFREAMIMTGVMPLLALYRVYLSDEPERQTSEKPSGFQKIVQNRQFFSLALSYFVTGLQFTGLTTLVGIIMKEKFEFNEIQIAAMFIAITFFHMLTMIKLKDWNRRIGAVRIMVTSLCVAILSHLAFFFPFVYSSWVPCAIFLVLATNVLPLCMSCGNLLAPLVADEYGTNARGATVGALRTIFNVGQAIGPAYGVWASGLEGIEDAFSLEEGGAFFLFQLMCMMFAALGLWFLVKTFADVRVRAARAATAAEKTKQDLTVDTNTTTSTKKDGWRWEERVSMTPMVKGERGSFGGGGATIVDSWL